MISDSEVSKFKDGRKPSLYDNEGTWIKREVFGLIYFEQNIYQSMSWEPCLFRDGELTVIHITNDPKLDPRAQDRPKRFIWIWRTIHLHRYLKENNFLDITFNLAPMRLFLYINPNIVPLYISSNIKDNHLY